MYIETAQSEYINTLEQDRQSCLAEVGQGIWAQSHFFPMPPFCRPPLSLFLAHFPILCSEEKGLLPWDAFIGGPPGVLCISMHERVRLADQCSITDPSSTGSERTG